MRLGANFSCIYKLFYPGPRCNCRGSFSNMPFQNQFSLSVELTKFVSLSQIAEGTFGAALKLARALQVRPLSLCDQAPAFLLLTQIQSSGSDIVVEADVVEIFGYSHITPILSSSFRTAVSLPHEPEELIAGISLFRGPGPTVLRALKNEAYFSTIVQCKSGINVKPPPLTEYRFFLPCSL